MLKSSFKNAFNIFRFVTIICITMFFNQLASCDDTAETLKLDVISYEDFIQNDLQALKVLKTALHEKGIVGIKGIPGYVEKVRAFIEQNKKFTALPEEVKNRYAPNRERGDLFLGYEAGKERFKRPDGRWVVDDLKVSYYAFVPDSKDNIWPYEVDLRTSFQDLGGLMSKMGKAVMEKIGLIGKKTNIYVDNVPAIGRILYYRSNSNSSQDNPFWCGAHLDHGLFTALLPAFYFKNGKPVPEPVEAGLSVRTTSDGKFRKVVSDETDILMFQVGEFGQLVTNDNIKATEHRVHKSKEHLERYAMALFFDPPMDTVIHSSSELTKDERYGGIAEAPCSYRNWHERSFARYIVKE